VQSKTADTNLPDVQNLAQAIFGYWAAVGVKAQYTPMEPTTLLTARRAGKLRGMEIAGYTAPTTIEPGFYGNVSFISSAPNRQVNDPDLDTLIKKINATLEITERAKLGTQFCDLHREPLLHAPADGLAGLDGDRPQGRPAQAAAVQQRGAPLVHSGGLRL
jgi:ABC-type transport system substrate-binding protein